MAENVKILGGYSQNRFVSIRSSEFVGKARALANNKIEFWSEKVPRIVGLIQKNRFWYLPKTVKLLVSILSEFSLKTLLFFLTAPLIGMTIAYTIGPIRIPIKDISLYESYFPFIVPTLIFSYIFLFVAPWHGAEHKAISAYLNNKRTGLKKIKIESRVTKLCGSRLFIPIILATFIPAFFFKENSCLVSLGLLEITLWIDKMWGWNSVPFFAHISLFIQRFLLTREPGELELLTAQAALRALLKAHHKKNNQ